MGFLVSILSPACHLLTVPSHCREPVNQCLISLGTNHPVPRPHLYDSFSLNLLTEGSNSSRVMVASSMNLE